MAQEREIATVWDRLQFLLSVDDDARWRVIGSTIIIVGACGSINFTLLDSSTEDVVFLMGALILLVSISQIGWYCSFRRPLVRRNPVRSISRRTLALQAGAFIAFILSLRLPHSEARTIERKLQQVSRSPSDPGSAKMAEKTLNAAKAASLRIDSRIIRDVGNGFIEAAAKNPDAWDAALAFVNYRSFLNAESFNLPTRPDAIQETKYELPPGKFVVGPFRTAQVVVPSEAPEIPQFRTLDAPDLNRGVSVGPSFLFIEGGTLVIDDLYLKRIIFRDLHVIFRGGRVVLQNVLFINCIFDIAQAPQGQTLASALVSGPITTFSSYRA